MARRKTRRKNPTPIQWAMIGVGTVVVGAGTYVTIRVIKDRRRKELLSKLPRPPEGSIGPVVGLPHAEPSPCGDDYPGFVFDGEGCTPGPDTPAGIYVGEGCSDFVSVEGDLGAQLDYLEEFVDREATRSDAADARSADPTHLAAEFLSQFWDECPWPPVPEGSERIVQLYEAMVYVIGREIIAAGGRVLGTKDPDVIDEQIAERLAELGYPEFNPDVVPEIELPDATPVQQYGVFISE